MTINCYRGIMQLSSHMVKLEVVKRLQWKGTNMYLQLKEKPQQLILMLVMMRESYLDQLGWSLISSSNSLIFKRKSLQYTVHICKYIKRRYMIS